MSGEYETQLCTAFLWVHSCKFGVYLVAYALDDILKEPSPHTDVATAQFLRVSQTWVSHFVTLLRCPSVLVSLKDRQHLFRREGNVDSSVRVSNREQRELRGSRGGEGGRTGHVAYRPRDLTLAPMGPVGVA